MKMHELDEIRPTPLATEIDRRRGDVASRPIPDPPRLARRVTAGVVAVAVFGLAVALGIGGLEEPPEPTPAADPWVSYGQGWSELPTPPEWRDGASIVWTDSELLYWGGTPRGEDVRARADGFAFDPASDRWSEVPAAPRAGMNDAAVWTGDEALFLARGPDGLDVQAFDPEARTWRSLPGQTEIPQFGGAWAWTGAELIVVGGGELGDTSNTGAWALDPAAETWRRVAEAPIPMNLSDAVWTGEEVVLVGSALDDRNRATTITSQAQAYDPATDAWRALSAPPVSAQTAAVAYVDGDLIAWEQYSPASAEWLPDEHRWRSFEMGGIDGSECYAAGATVDGALFTWNCGAPSAWFSATSMWAPVERPIPPATDIAFGVGRVSPAGTVVVVEEIETVEGDLGEPFIGSPAATVHLWVWRAPDAPPSAAWQPTTDDAENLVAVFISDWSAGAEPFLPTVATADVIARAGSGEGGLVGLEGGSVGWHEPATTVREPGVFEVAVDLTRGGEELGTMVFTVGPGTAADGRTGQLVITDVRPG